LGERFLAANTVTRDVDYGAALVNYVTEAPLYILYFLTVTPISRLAEFALMTKLMESCPMTDIGACLMDGALPSRSDEQHQFVSDAG